MYTSDAENSPPMMALSRYGVVGNLTGYGTFFSDRVRPEDIIKGVANKDVDVAIAWGPLAGYFAKSSPVPLTLTLLPAKDSLSELPLQYEIGIAVRRRDKEFRDSLQAVLERRRPDIEAVLKDYGVPLLPLEAGTRDKSAAETGKKAGPG
jgi:mxaJ protein